jgi:hypothetical protein
VGWDPQNIFAQAIDTIAGSVFGTEKPVKTRAITLDL